MRRQQSGAGIRLLIGLAIAAFSLFSYFSSSQYNEVTGENQYISLSPQQEIRLGLEAVPSLVQEFGGALNNREVQDAIDEIGFDLVNNSFAATQPWDYEFTVLDSDILNAFALPGGPMFITTEMLNQLDTVDEVAGVLAHEIVHVVARHGAQQIAQGNLANGLVGAVSVASGDANATQTAAMVSQLITLQYGRDDEIESDQLGVCIMLQAGYDPMGMIGVQETLRDARGAGGGQPEFFSTHPDPENRLQRIQEIINNPEQCP
ncbi:MAG: M48 family metalloprotease [Chloroflexota bacterium]